MRPYPDELLRSMQFSLDTYVIPNVDDKWGRYVAKVMRRMLVHLERRWQLEGPLLLEDIADLRDVLARVGADLREAELSDTGRVTELTASIDAALTATDGQPSGYVSVEQLTDLDEVLREALVEVIETCHLLAADAEAEADRLEPLRDRVREYLRRQVDRDNQLVEPTFMSFAPPTPAAEPAGDAA
jgi:hypothetical protein